MKLRNIKLLAVLILVPAICFSAIDDFKEERMKMLSDLGLPLPDSGIKLVPRSIFGLTKNEIKIGEQEEIQMKTKGYIEEYTSRPMELIHFKKHAKLQFKQYTNVLSDTSTHIRKSIKNLKLGFRFNGVPQNLIGNSIIGVVPQGGFNKNGWSGAVQFFESTSIGACAYAQMNVAASHTATEIALEDANYLINNKLTIFEVRGNKSSGFDYKLRWFDDISFHELECANIKYSKNISDNVISLAKQIDAAQ